MLRNRSLNKLPSGYPPWSHRPRKNGVTLRMKNARQQANGTHLEPAQTFSELLAELHIYLPLMHDVLS